MLPICQETRKTAIHSTILPSVYRNVRHDANLSTVCWVSAEYLTFMKNIDLIKIHYQK